MISRRILLVLMFCVLSVSDVAALFLAVASVLKYANVIDLRAVMGCPIEEGSKPHQCWMTILSATLPLGPFSYDSFWCFFVDFSVFTYLLISLILESRKPKGKYSALKTNLVFVMPFNLIIIWALPLVTPLPIREPLSVFRLFDEENWGYWLAAVIVWSVLMYILIFAVRLQLLRKSRKEKLLDFEVELTHPTSRSNHSQKSNFQSHQEEYEKEYPTLLVNPFYGKRLNQTGPLLSQTPVSSGEVCSPAGSGSRLDLSNRNPHPPSIRSTPNAYADNHTVNQQYHPNFNTYNEPIDLTPTPSSLMQKLGQSYESTGTVLIYEDSSVPSSPITPTTQESQESEPSPDLSQAIRQKYTSDNSYISAPTSSIMSQTTNTTYSTNFDTYRAPISRQTNPYSENRLASQQKTPSPVPIVISSLGKPLYAQVQGTSNAPPVSRKNLETWEDASDSRTSKW